MDVAGQSSAWTGSQLAARLAALNGVAPPPAHYVLWRASRHPDGSETLRYDVPDQPLPLPPAGFPAWLQHHALLGEDQLRVAVLVIREALDAAGRLIDCVLERRRGAPDGPFCGDPARVEFLGPARAVRSYQATRDGQLRETQPSPPTLPFPSRRAERFAGEQQALERFFGRSIQVIDARDPTLFEDMAGLASILHLRRTNPREPAARADDTELACGIGWFGTTPFVLVADFPHFGIALGLPPADDAAVQAVLRRDRLVRHETRLDEHGLAVLARRQGGQALLLLRVEAGEVHAEPYQPNAVPVGGQDQQGWLRHAETYERLVPLDQHRDGSSGDIVVLTGDAGGHVWRHLVDPDGVETWRRPADDAAVAALYRERLSPGRLAQSEADAPGQAFDRPVGPDPDTEAPADSLLATVHAFSDATTALRMASELARLEPGAPEILASLHVLRSALDRLCAENTASRCERLLADAEAGLLEPVRFARSLPVLEASLRDELALTRLVLLQPGQWRRLTDASTFGAEVEARFPGCAYDIEEAASCLAFRRPSAAVFHCMKILERGLLALGKLAGLADAAAPQRGWSDILASLAASPAALAPILAHVKRIRRRWRAVTLLPAEKYTETEAEAVFQALGAFMRELAARCDERGDALAPNGKLRGDR